MDVQTAVSSSSLLDKHPSKHAKPAVGEDGPELVAPKKPESMYEIVKRPSRSGAVLTITSMVSGNERQLMKEADSTVSLWSLGHCWEKMPY